MQRNAAVLLIAGALLFAGAVFSPPIFNVFSVNDQAQQLAVIQGNLAGWRIANALLAIGALIVVIGFVVLARHLVAVKDSDQVRWVGYAGAALIVVGALFWLVVQYDRMTSAPETIVYGQPLGGIWVFVLYTILTLAGLIVVGYVLLRAGYPRWLGWGCMGLNAYILVKVVLTWDAVPLEWYINILALGIVLLFVKPRLDAMLSGRQAQLTPSSADSEA